MDKKLETFSKALSLLFKIGITTGVAVMIFYSWGIGYTPRDITFGDGLMFIMFAMSFGIVYLFFIVSLTNLGRVVWYAIQRTIDYFVKRFKLSTKMPEKIKDSFSKLRIETPSLWISVVFAILGVVLILGLGFGSTTWVMWAVLAFALAAFWSGYLKNVQQLSADKENAPSENLNKSTQINKVNKYPLLWIVLILIVPIALGQGITSTLITASMDLVNVRENNVTVHIKAPYDKYVLEYGAKSKPSRFGPDYIELDNVLVLFHGFGKDVVIRVNKANDQESLAIPSDHIFVIKK